MRPHRPVARRDHRPSARPIPVRRPTRAAAVAGALGAAGWLLLARVPFARACPVCFGDPNNAQTKATRAAVFFLLGLTALVVIGVARLFLRIARHAREAERNAPPPGDVTP